MTAYEYLLARQAEWAMNRGIRLTGSKGERGRPAYAPTLRENLFEQLSTAVLTSLRRGHGGETKGTRGSPAKMQAAHSSSALGVNIFHYWERIGRVSEIAAACGFCRRGSSVPQKIVFEDKYVINERELEHPPNIDVVIHNADSSRVKRFAVESKFSEPYNPRGHDGIKSAYLRLHDIWGDIPALHDMAQALCPDDDKYRYLHAAQLIKHILGLKVKLLGKDRFNLLYLWYNAPGEDGAKHKEEVEDFAKAALSDGIDFHALTYQELILRLSHEYRDSHPKYIKYITERYL